MKKLEASRLCRVQSSSNDSNTPSDSPSHFSMSVRDTSFAFSFISASIFLEQSTDIILNAPVFVVNALQRESISEKIFFHAIIFTRLVYGKSPDRICLISTWGGFNSCPGAYVPLVIPVLLNFSTYLKYLSMFPRMTICSASDKSLKNFGLRSSGRNREWVKSTSSLLPLSRNALILSRRNLRSSSSPFRIFLSHSFRLLLSMFIGFIMLMLESRWVSCGFSLSQSCSSLVMTSCLLVFINWMQKQTRFILLKFGKAQNILLRISLLNCSITSSFNSQYDMVEVPIASQNMSSPMFRLSSMNCGVHSEDMMRESRSTGHWIELTYLGRCFPAIILHLHYTSSARNGKYHRKGQL